MIVRERKDYNIMPKKTIKKYRYSKNLKHKKINFSRQKELNFKRRH